MNAKQLRDSILQYAMQGKLTQQNLDDLSAFELLDQVEKERENALKNKLLRKETIKPITNTPEELPKNWACVRLPHLCMNENGSIRRGPFGSAITKSMFVSPDETTYKVYEQGNAIQKTCEYGSYNITAEDFKKLKNFEVFPGDIIVSCAGTIGEVYVIPNGAPKGIINQALMKLSINENIVDLNFFLLAFESIVSNLKKNAKGSAIKNLASLKFLKNEVIFPLPPFEEQQRIVKVVHSLYKKVDSYGILAEQLNVLKSNISNRLDKSILQYAMQGKLVEQDLNDEPASQLIERINEEKVKLIEQKVIKTEKPLPPITEDEIPFEIPPTWEWMRLNDISIYIQRGKSPKYSLIEHTPVISQKCVQWSGFTFEPAKFIDPDTLEKYDDIRFLKSGDILWNSTGLGTIGRVGLYDESFNPYEQAVVDSHVTIVRTSKLVDSQYIYYYLASPEVQNSIEDIASGSTKQKELNTSTIKSILIPIPPLNEQKRIVNKIDELLSLTNFLK
ncbi:restriction endonuclease subunit S [Aneurinibacillus aneurinilyticus]|uniref:restriction endonuclease subunit S n=1 Tax=Aneurinibacillus aneurinilyticus TaxID=1391 RepID=UPI0023F36B23|nr:restriction endonuclease subunit S [Aneurinibacillus aneurinilyticus]